MPDTVVFGKFSRLVQTGALGIEQPAMERTAQAVGFKPAIAQISLTMRTMPVDQSQRAFAITKQHQILTKDAHRHHRPVARQFV